MLYCWKFRSAKSDNAPMTQPTSTPADRLASVLAAAQRDLRTATSVADEHGREQYARAPRMIAPPKSSSIRQPPTNNDPKPEPA